MKIYYFSVTKNTEILAKTISKKLQGELVEIKPKKAYSSFLPLFFLQAITTSVAKKPIALQDYPRPVAGEDIIICFPVWGDNLPAPISAFLQENQLTDSSVYLVSTSIKSNPEDGWANFGNLQPQAKLVAKVNFFSNKKEKMVTDRADVLAWLSQEF